LKFGIEHFRRRKPHCSGALFWQLNDCWPVLSWSLVDYYGFGKAGYFYARRVFAPLLASFKDEADGGVSLWITNDTLDVVNDTIAVREVTFSGEVLWEDQVQAQIPANASVEVGRLDSVTRQPDCYLCVKSGSGIFPANRHFYAAVKDLERETVEPQVTITQLDNSTVEVIVTAPKYVFFFHLTHSSEFTQYSDNYFDMEAGETRVVLMWNDKEKLEPEGIGFGYR
jgi:beta-mannosidase